MNKTKIFFTTYLIFIIISIVMIFSYILIFFPLKYKEEVLLASNEYNLEPCLVASIINAESRFDKNATSHAGAMGLMQLLPSTAKEIAIKLGLNDFVAEDLFKPEINIKFGCFYFSELYTRFRDLNTTICAYNAGPNKVQAWLKDKAYSSTGKSLDSTPYSETNKYLNKILNSINIYRNYF